MNDHGRTFHNRGGVRQHGLGSAFRMLREFRHPRWDPIPVAPAPPPPERVEGLRVTWVGHATTLIQAGGVNLLTDPTWSRRASPFSFAGPRRFADPGLRLEDLPSLDAVVVSHDHYDHLDLPTLRRLEASAFVVPLGLGRHVPGARELDWYDRTEVPGVAIHAVPAQHFSGRGLSRNATLWCGFVFDTPAGRVHWVGDSGWDPSLYTEIGERLGPMRLAIVPIGAYAPPWFMAPVHVDPEEAVALAQAVGARHALGVHHRTFRLSTEPRDEPAERFLAAAAEAGLDARVLEHGGHWEVPA